VPAEKVRVEERLCQTVRREALAIAGEQRAMPGELECERLVALHVVSHQLRQADGVQQAGCDAPGERRAAARDEGRPVHSASLAVVCAL